METVNGPRITASFASPEIRPGAVWKVYLKASDPAGQMRYIVAEIRQAGRSSYPPARIRIREEDRKNLSGYIYLNSGSESAGQLNSLALTLTVRIQDRSGDLSPEVSFPLSWNDRADPQDPPFGTFEEEDLGPVMIQLEPTVSP